MLTRDAVMLYHEVQSDTATQILDINVEDPISAFFLEVYCTNGATSNKGNFISDIVTKVEVVDGSEVLATLNMSQLEALHFYKTGKTPALFPSEWASGLQRDVAALFFGRYLWDKELIFDPTLYRNPQIKVTFNKAAIRAAGATGYADATNIYLSVVAKVMQEGAERVGFLGAKQINSFTSASSGDKRIELPNDYPYRLLMLRAYVQGSDIDEVISDLKLTCDTDKHIPFNRKVAQLDAEAFGLFGAGRVKHDIFCSHQDTVRLVFNKEPDVRVYFDTVLTPSIVGVDWAWSSNMKLNIYDADGVADTTDRKYTMVEEGHALHATLPVPFGLMDSPDSWFDPRVFGKVEAVLTQATADAVVEVVLEQLRP